MLYNKERDKLVNTQQKKCCPRERHWRFFLEIKKTSLLTVDLGEKITEHQDEYALAGVKCKQNYYHDIKRPTALNNSEIKWSQ